MYCTKSPRTTPKSNSGTGRQLEVLLSLWKPCLANLDSGRKNWTSLIKLHLLPNFQEKSNLVNSSTSNSFNHSTQLLCTGCKMFNKLFPEIPIISAELSLRILLNSGLYSSPYSAYAGLHTVHISVLMMCPFGRWLRYLKPTKRALNCELESIAKELPRLLDAAKVLVILVTSY